MGNLFASLLSTTSALRAYDRSLSVIQNNVSNADTPGFVRQRITFIPRLFDPDRGLAGGVEAGALVSSRDAYAERNVWQQTHQLGRWSQQAADIEQIESFFPIGRGAGLAGSIDRFFNSVASWSVNPNDPVGRQVVLDRAGATARSFNDTADALGAAAGSADRQIRATVERINTLAERIRDLNVERRDDVRKLQDPSLDAKIHATLEELSALADFNTLEQPDGSITLLFGGQTPLVIGDRLQKLTVDFSQPQPVLLNENDQDITGQLTSGSLYGLIDTRNSKIPAYQASLNQLAEAFADRVNQTLAGGLDQNGSNPTLDLFTYDATVGSAATLAVNALTTDQLAGADPGAPGGNANALRLAALATSNEVGGVSFTEFHGQITALVGRDLVRARENADLQRQLVNQAHALREERSGVSLDEEAARLVEAQRAYQANTQLFTVLNSLTDTLLGLFEVGTEEQK